MRISRRVHRKQFLAFTLLVLLGMTNAQFGLASQVETDGPVTDSPIKDKWALVVGVSNFANPAINLKYAAKDASDFADFLVKKCNFAADHVKLLTNEKATRNRILDLLGDSWLPRVALPDDLVVIFISSHGSPSEMDVCGVNYIVAHDTNPEKLFTTGLPIQQLAATIKERVHSNRVLVILDACHSGGAGEASKGIQRTSNVDASMLAQGTGHMVICSSSKSEASWESKKVPNGVFTHTLIKSLQKNGSNTKLAEAFSSLKDEVQSEVAAERGVMQTPVLEMTKWKGHDLVLAAVPTSPRKPPPALNLEDNVSCSTSMSQSSAQQSSAQQSTSSLTETKSGTTIPDITGSFLGSNGLLYTYWQKGRECGWEMPQFFETCKCKISEDGKTLFSKWTGALNGSGSAELEVDTNNRVIRIVADNGTILTRIEK